MAISFDNESTKKYLAKYGRPAKVFGENVDDREAMFEVEAVAWFDDLWAHVLTMNEPQEPFPGTGQPEEETEDEDNE
ncbi:MAG: hypothetical protein ACC628_28305 [Pirellulaceae bacterium]